MSVELKAFLVAVPLALAMFAILIVGGFFIWGGDWNMTGLPIISLATGFVAYRIVKSHFDRTGRTE